MLQPHYASAAPLQLRCHFAFLPMFTPLPRDERQRRRLFVRPRRRFHAFLQARFAMDVYAIS